MGKHEHNHIHCQHTNVAYCNHCNVCYCKGCGREWGRNNQWTYTTYPYVTYPYTTVWGNTTFNTDIDKNTGTNPEVISICSHN